MGFRNPITTAAAVNTGHGSGDAGVRLYQDLTVPAVPQGVAEWRTGSMERNASVRLAGGFSGGSDFAVDGGKALGINAGSLDLQVEGAPAGGYLSSATLAAGDLVRLNGPSVQINGHEAPRGYLTAATPAGNCTAGSARTLCTSGAVNIGATARRLRHTFHAVFYCGATYQQVIIRIIRYPAAGGAGTLVAQRSSFPMGGNTPADAGQVLIVANERCPPGSWFWVCDGLTNATAGTTAGIAYDASLYSVEDIGV